MIGPGLVGSDLDGKGVEVVAVFLVRRMGEEHVDRVGCVPEKLGELVGRVALGKDDEVQPVRDGAISEDGLDRGLGGGLGMIPKPKASTASSAARKQKEKTGEFKTGLQTENPCRQTRGVSDAWRG